MDLFEREELDAVIHLAGYKAVGDAVKSPLKYYRNNIASTTSLLEVMDNYGVRKIILSSSANVYGESSVVPVNRGVRSEIVQILMVGLSGYKRRC